MQNSMTHHDGSDHLRRTEALLEQFHAVKPGTGAEFAELGAMFHDLSAGGDERTFPPAFVGRLNELMSSGRLGQRARSARRTKRLF